MLFLLVRHAQAAARDEALYPDDSVRPLVEKGRRVQRRVSARLSKNGLVPTVIFSSPWKRAWQTAGILAQETGVGKKRRVACPPLADAPNLAALATAIGVQSPDATIALVGHEPWMGELASLLLSGSPTRLGIDFAKSGVIGIEASALEPAAGRLRFYLTPQTC